MSWKQFFGVDKWARFAQIVKQQGGVKGALKKRYLMDTTRVGTLVGEDQFGNKYYEDNSYFMPRNRWVEFPEKVWLDYDASQIPPEWHRWMHHIADDPPSKKPLEKPSWGLDHKENLSINLNEKYVPYATTRTKIQGWTPPEKK